MTIKHIFASAFLIACLSASAQDMREHNMDVGQFTKLIVNDNVNVVYSCLQDSTGTISFKCPDTVAGAFYIENTKGTLKIQVLDEYVNNPELPTLYVYSDFLTNAENYSDKLLILTSVAPCAELTINQIGNGRTIAKDIKCTKLKSSLQTGNGSVVLNGFANNASYTLLGTGVIQADQMKANNVNCLIGGTGSIGCWATTELRLRGIGSTKVYYKGDPKIKKNWIGGKLEKIYTE